MRRPTLVAALLAALLVIAARAHAQPAAPQGASRVLEPFDDAAAFTTAPSDGVLLALRADSGVVGPALRFDFDFQGRAGYAVARRAFSLGTLPPHWAVTLWMRGDAPPNTLEIKLVDSTGLNVWWLRRPDVQVARGWTQLRFRPSELTFAWGPLGGGPPRGIASFEIAITAGAGGRGWLALDDLTLTPLPLPVADSRRPRVAASSSISGRGAALALPADFARAPGAMASTSGGWRSAADGAQSLTLDFGGPRDLTGLALDWSPLDYPVDYDVERSDDGRTWTLARAVRGSAGGRRFVHLPGEETSWLRLALHRSSRGQGYALGALRILDSKAAPTRSAFLERVADASARGTWPRPFTGQQSYWTVVGLPRDERDALVSEDGSVESRPGGFSVEPFVHADGRLLTWRDGTTSQSLDGGSRPIPTVRRVAGGLVLETTAFATGAPGASVLWVRYTLANQRATPRTVRLFAAVRPVQVNPPWQFLGAAGGAAPVRSLRWDGRALVVNDTDAVVAVTRPTSAGVIAFDAGPVTDAMRTGTLPDAQAVVDSTELASGALAWDLSLVPNGRAEVWLALPAPGARDALAALPPTTSIDSARASGTRQLDAARAAWDRELGAVDIALPGTGAALARTIRSSLAWVLINARGPAIQPGTRSYRRSWIRDGALTSAALMRLGHASDARAFLDWYVPFQFPNGKVPCCVDARGADPVAENDSDGELLYLAAEYWRISDDTAGVVRHWPALARAAEHLDSLRRSTRTARYQTPDSLLVFGLLPPSISHEGYSAKPAYSYWDDWWGVRGLDDAGLLARLAGDDVRAARFTEAGREMRRDVIASYRRAMQVHGIRHLAGAAELGDLDPTSTTIALEPAQALGDLPADALRATFDSAWRTLDNRRTGRVRWEIFTPYEWRQVGSFIRIGQPARAHAVSAWLMTMRRPTAWNQWSEAIWRVERTPKFVGDMPHGWVHSDFVRATLDMLAYERESDATLVVGAGVPAAWARAADGVTVRGMRTWWGALDLTVRTVGSAVRVTVGGATPPGGIEVRAPFDAPPRSVLVNGAPATLIDAGRAVIVRAPAVVEFRY
jgi:hypothetical protein